MQILTKQAISEALSYLNAVPGICVFNFLVPLINYVQVSKIEDELRKTEQRLQEAEQKWREAEVKSIEYKKMMDFKTLEWSKGVLAQGSQQDAYVSSDGCEVGWKCIPLASCRLLFYGATVYLLKMHNYGLDEKQCIITNMQFHVPS